MSLEKYRRSLRILQLARNNLQDCLSREPNANGRFQVRAEHVKFHLVAGEREECSQWAFGIVVVEILDLSNAYVSVTIAIQHAENRINERSFSAYIVAYITINSRA